MQIKIADIIIPEGNPRIFFNESEIEELAKSIKNVGLISPITVQENSGKYYLIAGERRLRASIINQSIYIECSVLNKDVPQNVIDKIRIIENIQRKDLHPYEEAKHIEKLLQKENDVNSISISLSKTERYVRNRLVLLDLKEEAIDLFINNVINIGHATQIARLNNYQQKEVLDKIISVPDVNGKRYALISSKQLFDYILKNITIHLKYAPFSLEEEKNTQRSEIKSVSCLKCTFRSGCNSSLFYDISDEDICFNKKCYNAKVEEHCAEIQDAYEGNGFSVVRLTNSLFNNEFKNDSSYNISFEEVSIADKPEDVKIGVYFDNLQPNKIGRVVKILSPGSKNTKPPEQKGVYGKRLERAKKAFYNSVLKEVSYSIGQNPTELMNAGVIKYMALFFYKSLNSELKQNIKNHYHWKIKSTNIVEEFYKNILGYSLSQITELMMFCMFYGTLRSDLHQDFKDKIVQISEKTGIDVVRIKKEVQKQFDVEL